MTDTRDLGGPLPTVDESNQNKRRSRIKLDDTLPVDRLVFRAEHEDDFGVDGSLEVHASGKATNLRSATQLKSKEHAEPNKDGSISFSTEVTNLVYLLNGPSPLYILYVVDTDTLCYAWVRDEVRRIEAAKPDWKDQGTVTLRFATPLDARTCDSIWSRIMLEGIFTRRVFSLLSSAMGDRLDVAVTPGTLELTTREGARQLLIDRGLALTHAGHPHLVIEAAASLTERDREQPGIALSLGYAEYIRGRYAASDGHLGLARLREAELDARKKQLLNLLSNGCDLELGRIDTDTYLAAEERIVGPAPSPLRRQHLARTLWARYLGERAPDKIGPLVTDLQALQQESERDPNDSRENRLHLTINLLTAETDQEITDLLTINAQGQVAERVDLPWLSRDDVRPQWSARWDSLIARLVAAAAETRSLGSPVLLGQADALIAFAEFQRVLMERLMSIPMNGPAPDLDSEVYRLMPIIDGARTQAASIGLIEEEIRFTLTLAEMFFALGNDEAGQRLAADALRRAKAVRYQQLIARAAPLTTGDWYIRRFERQLRDLRAIDEDVLLARENDAELERLARTTLHALDLPQDRFAEVRRDHEALRMVARERLSFCQHLRLSQDLAHTLSRDTFYAQTPMKRCRCELLGHESSADSTDERALIAEFKQRHCQTCTRRAPKAP